jgi:hypothetical protein
MLTRKSVRLRILGSLAVAAALALPSGPAMASGSDDHRPMGYTCTGGDIPTGNYASITVKGFCDVPADAVINVAGNVNVAPGAFLDAQSAPSTITVGHNVTAGAGSLVGLGCQPDYPHNTGHPCAADPSGHSTVTIRGNVMAFGAGVFLMNGITVRGNVTMLGGGNETIPWSIKNNMIGGNLTVGGQTTDWLGVLFNTVGKNVVLIHITVNDPGDPSPTMFVVRNTIGRNLICEGLAPAVSGGFFPGEVNVVGGHAFGQCASLV